MGIPQKNENRARQKDCESPPSSRTQTAVCLKFKFPKTARILSKIHYKSVVKAGNKFVGNLIVMDFRRGRSTCPKLGITVSKRYGKAHDRNRFKRVVREAFRLSRDQLPFDIEINVIPRLPAQKVTKHSILNDLDLLIAHLRSLDNVPMSKFGAGLNSSLLLT
jgi:ribonuclease P protein component